MSFIRTYPETAFISKGSNPVVVRKLKETIESSAIVETLERIYISNFGTQSAEDPNATGRIWAFQFAGAGPTLSGGGETLLEAIVEGHDGVSTMPSGHPGAVHALLINHIGNDVRHLPTGGTALQVLRKNAANDAIEWAENSGGGGGGPATPETTVVGRVPLFSDTTGDSLGQSGTTINAVGQVNIATQTDYATDALSITTTTGTMRVYHIPTLVPNPPTDITSNDDALLLRHGGLFTQDRGRWSTGKTWFRPGDVRGIYGLSLTRSANSVSVSAGQLIDSQFFAHETSTMSISTSLTSSAGGLDTGTFSINTWYYIYLICNRNRAYNVVCSLSEIAPNLLAGAFTSTEFKAIARIGSFRTTSTATVIAKFTQIGQGSRRTYIVDDATSFNVTASAITTTTYATFGASGTGGSLPKTAITATMRCTCNSTSGLQVRPDASSGIQSASRPNSAGDTIMGYTPNGTFQLANVISSGSSTAVIVAYDEEVMS